MGQHSVQHNAGINENFEKIS